MNNFPTIENINSLLATPQIKLAPICDYKLIDQCYEVFHDQIPCNKRLGKLIEDIFEIYIAQQTSIKVLLKNFQIIDNKRTAGEIDYIIENALEKKIYHLELTYKFYLWKEDVPENWVGPNLKDAFWKKRDKLINHQFKMIDHPLVISKLKEMNISPEKIQPAVCFKAQLFLPPSFNKKIPKNFRDCVAGHYVNIDQFLEIHYENQAYIPAKQEWHILPEFNQKWTIGKDLTKQIKAFHHRQFSPLIWIKTTEGEYQKCFVVWWL